MMFLYLLEIKRPQMFLCLSYIVACFVFIFLFPKELLEEPLRMYAERFLIGWGGEIFWHKICSIISLIVFLYIFFIQMKLFRGIGFSLRQRNLPVQMDNRILSDKKLKRIGVGFAVISICLIMVFLILGEIPNKNSDTYDDVIGLQAVLIFSLIFIPDLIFYKKFATSPKP